MAENANEIIVIGAGVVGLTTALKIQEKGGYHVTIIAETLPTDPKTSRYTSHWAGAQHATSADSPGVHPNQLEMDKETFRIMWDLSAPGSDAAGCFMRLQMASYAGHQLKRPSVWEFMPDFKYLTEEELVPTMVDGSSFTTVTIDVPVYLNYLFSRFLSKGGAAVKGQVQHVKQVIEGGVGAFTGAKNYPKPVAVVVCAGLGARFLGGVEDKDMYPIRGQTVLVRAPWVKEMPCFHLANGAVSYVIPRRSGDVIIGGTFLVDDWYPTARSDTKREILERVIKLYPNIAPPDIRAVREPTVADLEAIVIEDGCGLRPGRKGGVRLEVDSSGSIPLVFNYGHGGYGYQSSWGTAGVALTLLEGVLAAKHD
ncbi:FAD dependent oxidoreductase [Armillaria mellea]|nr:FAD dependent oxidoreductase [Armillaria mellea]